MTISGKLGKSHERMKSFIFPRPVFVLFRKFFYSMWTNGSLLVFCLVIAGQFPSTRSGLIGRRQRVIVKGKLLCASIPAANVLVKLLDEDDGGINDLMAERRTNEQGEFLVDGEESEITNVDPILKIFHDCNDNLPCQREWKLKIPDLHINTHKPADIGVWNLEAILPGESRSCFYK